METEATGRMSNQLIEADTLLENMEHEKNGFVSMPVDLSAIGWHALNTARCQVTVL